MKQVLFATETESQSFRFYDTRDRHSATPVIITFPDDGTTWGYGTWKLQMQTP